MKCLGRRAAGQEYGPIASLRLMRVRENDFGRLAAVAAILGEADFLGGVVMREGR